MHTSGADVTLWGAVDGAAPVVGQATAAAASHAAARHVGGRSRRQHPHRPAPVAGVEEAGRCELSSHAVGVTAKAASLPGGVMPSAAPQLTHQRGRAAELPAAGRSGGNAAGGDAGGDRSVDPRDGRRRGRAGGGCHRLRGRPGGETLAVLAPPALPCAAVGATSPVGMVVLPAVAGARRRAASAPVSRVAVGAPPVCGRRLSATRALRLGADGRH